jgi:Flp pilus assembly protein TadG
MSRGRDDGAVTVEFAAVALFALALLFGLVLLGVHAAYSGLAEHGARKAARAAAVRSLATGQYPNDDEIMAAAEVPNGVLGTPVSVVVDRRAGSGTSIVPCTVDGTGGTRRCGQGDIVTVTITYGTPGLSAVSGAVPGFAGRALETITREASARFE